MIEGFDFYQPKNQEAKRYPWLYLFECKSNPVVTDKHCLNLVHKIINFFLRFSKQLIDSGLIKPCQKSTHISPPFLNIFVLAVPTKMLPTINAVRMGIFLFI